ncbi:hypothetical protein AAFF_G00412050 [Aldrovandia affinis]|uniref:Uncharacterized protein n=1 Tax=Aldrovandia affinis TaxID=143900 RepID=A0AAD7WJV0_9TELE|nr:hypothetical protein AAFF_G00412050 [Aldrovandia affinis]
MFCMRSQDVCIHIGGYKMFAKLYAVIGCITECIELFCVIVSSGAEMPWLNSRIHFHIRGLDKSLSLAWQSHH